MTCFAPKCTVKKDGERQVVCWLCDDLYHMKCVGLLARTTDQLVDADMGLRWCCLKCRKVDIEFYKFFTSTRHEFSEMHTEFASLYAKFRKFEERFVNFNRLDKLAEEKMSPSSPKRKKGLEMVTVQQVNMVEPPIVVSEIEEPPVQSLAPPITRARGILSPNLIEFDPKSPIVTADPKLPNVSVGIQGNKSPNVPGSGSERSDTTSDQYSSSARRELTVVKRRKTIFVSRLTRDTTADDLLHYVKSNLDGEHDLLCFKINPNSTRGISSFRLIVPCDVFDRIVDCGFWPLGILVREYVYRESSGPSPVSLPPHVQPSSNRSKN